MSLEYKADELSRNILLLSAKTEQRHQQSEQNLAVSQASLKQAEEVLERASKDIYQVTKETVQKKPCIIRKRNLRNVGFSVSK